MPIPNTKDIGKIISFLKKEKPKMKKDQIVAIALSKVKGKKKK